MSTLTHPKTAAAPLVVSGLEPYAGTWSRQQAAHLLRRTMFGPKRQEIIDAIALGLDGTVAALLAPQAPASPPLNHFFTEDPNVPVGETWVTAPFVEGVDVGQYRWPSLRGWLYQSMHESPMSIRDKMMFFWNNHFGMADVGDHRVQYQYVRLFRQYATGNFKHLIKEITIHPSMLRFLNGEYNNKWSPNENYARELLELFTIGKGPQVGPGDYTNYTEQDVTEMARILTGWRNSGMWSNNPEQQPASWFDSNWHDEGDKTLSYRFDDAVIANAGSSEYENLIDLIFTKDEVARFICRKLYRYFVYYKLSDTVELEMIEPMAQLLIDNNYELYPVLEVLFKSQHFYDISIAGDVIKNPIEFILGITRPMNWSADFELELKYNSGNALHWWATQFDLDFFYPPSVSGWKAWYLAPTFNRIWLNSTTIQRRADLTNGIGWSGIWVTGEGRPMDWLGFIANFNNPTDPNALVAEFSEIFLPQALVQEQLDDLKEILIPGLPDFEWTDEYGLYLVNPENEMIRNSVDSKLRALVRGLFRMGEFQLN